jgi:hypothetical protein
MRIESEQGQGTVVRVKLPHAVVSEAGLPAVPENSQETEARLKGAA